MARRSRFERRPWALGAAVLGLAMLAVYITLILAEGGNSFSDVMPWALVMALASAGAFASTQVQDRRMSRSLIISSAAAFAALGLVSLFTIGLGFLLAAFAATVAATPPSGADDA